jgi:hypothetical protein
MHMKTQLRRIRARITRSNHVHPIMFVAAFRMRLVPLKMNIELARIVAFSSIASVARSRVAPSSEAGVADAGGIIVNADCSVGLDVTH